MHTSCAAPGKAMESKEQIYAWNRKLRLDTEKKKTAHWLPQKRHKLELAQAPKET